MAKVAFTAPGLTLDDIEKAVARGLGWLETDGTVGVTALAKIDQAITIAGQSALLWHKTPWWWARKKGTFSTLAGTSIGSGGVTNGVASITTAGVHNLVAGDIVYVASNVTSFNGTATVVAATTTSAFTYAAPSAVGTPASGYVYRSSSNLRSLIVDVLTPLAVYSGTTYKLDHISKGQYDQNITQLTQTGQPYQYALSGDLNISLWPVPTSTYTITVPYIQQHSSVTSAGSTDAALIVPAEFKWGVYVSGAEFLLRHETLDPGALEQCPEFAATMIRMQASSPKPRSEDAFPDAIGSLPNNLRIDIGSDTIDIYNTPTL